MLKHTKKEYQKICELYQKGYSCTAIAKKYNSYNTSIRRVLIKNGIEIRPHKSYIKRYVNESLFSTLPLSQEEEYFLGLIITDGCISNNALSLSLKYEDLHMLKSFAKFLGKDVKVNNYFHKKHNKKQYYVKVRSKLLCNNLKKLAVFNNKSFELKLKIPLTFNILRGIIDGDGHINTKTLSGRISVFGNSLEFLKQIQKFYLTHNIKSKINKSRDLYSLDLYKQKDILFLYEKMYCQVDLFLIRKKNNYGPLLKKFNR
jgi:hypothetical protein